MNNLDNKEMSIIDSKDDEKKVFFNEIKFYLNYLFFYKRIQTKEPLRKSKSIMMINHPKKSISKMILTQYSPKTKINLLESS